MRTLGIIGALLLGCTAAELEQIDPVTYVDGETCPDAHGVRQKVIAGYFCCDGPPSYAGPGQCPEGTSCLNAEDCTTMPIPGNDPTEFGARAPHRRAGL